MTTLAVTSATSQRLADFYSERRRPFSKKSVDDYTAYAKIVSQVKKGRYQSAFEELSALRKQGNGPIEAYALEISLACYHYQITLNDKYVEHAWEVIAEAPHHLLVTLAEIEISIVTGELEKALLDSVPAEHPRAWWYQRWIHEERRDWTKAITAIHDSLLGRESWQQYLALGRAEMEVGLVVEAREHLKKALSLVPQSSSVKDYQRRP